MIIMIDNYDSFTYNLYQYIGTINPDIEVYRNDKITVEEVLEKAGDIPILGVCLGHQAIGEAFGGKIVHAPRIMHGKSDVVTVDMDCPIFDGIGVKTEVGRYHSLVIDEESLPNCLNITARSDDDCIMGVQHNERPVYGIQFHPESVLTPNGMKMIENFLNI